MEELKIAEEDNNVITSEDKKYTNEDLKIMQAWDLQKKIQVAQTRILEWYKAWNRQVKVITLTNPYIFMSADTIEEFIKITGYSSDGLEGVLPSGKCGTYVGCKVFCDTTKKFGDIELR